MLAPTRTRSRTALLTAVLALAALVPTLGSASAADPQRLTVDLADSEGPVTLGANGALYGLGDDGVPSDAALAP